MVAAIIHHDGKILAAKRLEGGPSGLKWEFPGGKVEVGETSENALAREIEEELGIIVSVGPSLGLFSTVLGALQIDLECLHCHALTDGLVLSAHSEARWFEKEDLKHLDWAQPDLPVIEYLLESKPA